MTAFKYIYFIFTFLVLSSCISGKQSVTHENLPKINGKISVNLYDDSADKTIIYAGDDDLYFIHHQSSPMLSRFNLTKDTLNQHTGFINIGSGPNEMQSLMLYSVSPEADKILFQDPNLKKSLEFYLHNDSISFTNSYLGLLNKNNYTILDFAIGNSYGIIATYLSNKDTGKEGVVGYISSADSIFTPIKGVGTEDMINLSFRKQIFYSLNSQIFTQPKGDKCLFVSSIGQYAEIFNIKDDKAINKKILIDNVPSFTLDERGRMIDADDDLKFGFKVCVTPDRIYLAPFRMTYAERKDGLKNNPKYDGPARGIDFVEEIWEYDWDGNMLKKSRLIPGFTSFKVSSDKILWATS